MDCWQVRSNTLMRWLLLALVLLAGCAVVPRGERLTVDGQEYVRPAQIPMETPTWPDGTLIPQAELDRIGWEPPHRYPAWECLAADYASTGVGIATGLAAEANPLGLAVAVPLGIAGTIYAKKAEREGDDVMAKWSARIHCTAAAWNVAMLLVLIL